MSTERTTEEKREALRALFRHRDLRGVPADTTDPTEGNESPREGESTTHQTTRPHDTRDFLRALRDRH